MNVQRALLDKLRKYDFPKDEFAVLSAMVLGNREFMDKDIKNSYANTGASIFLAVSGLHVGVVFFVLSFVLSLFWKERHARWLRTVVLLLALWSYAFITGLPSSVVRASVMLSFVCLGMALNRKSSIYNTMAASAFFMLLYHPFYLFDVSFQLSYMACGLSWHSTEDLCDVFFQKMVASEVWVVLSVSLAAQIGTVPISLYYFHQFANYFGCRALWWCRSLAVVIYLAIFLFALPPIPYLCDFVAVVLNVVLWVMNQSIYWIERFPLATTYNIRFVYGGCCLCLSDCYLIIYVSLRYHVRNLSGFDVVGMLYFAFLFARKWEIFDYEYFAVYNIKMPRW
jgi:competence protein ComEC